MRKDGEQRAVCVLRDAAAAALLRRESKWAVRSVSLMGRAGTRQAATETLGAVVGRGVERRAVCVLRYSATMLSVSEQSQNRREGHDVNAARGRSGLANLLAVDMSKPRGK